MPATHSVCLTGATGYVGGRLLPLLARQGQRVTCLTRRPAAIRCPEGCDVRVVEGDVVEGTHLGEALEGVDTAYYLVHSMGAKRSFEEADRQAARHFAAAAKRAGVQRIIYLGGLAHDESPLSPHLRSRHEVGRILRESSCQVLEFRASIVIGSGSLSFEMVRSLVERLPVMVTPRWVWVPAQPIAIDDLLAYLLAALELPDATSRIYEIGGADEVTYGDLMRVYARERGLRRPMLPVPVITPRLSSLWLGLVTPLYARVGRKLVESIVHPTVVKDTSARTAFPDIKPMGMQAAVQRALIGEEIEFATTRWSDALSAAGPVRQWGGVTFGTRLVDSRTLDVPVAPTKAFAAVMQIGGANGWYAWNGLWQLRGALDLLVGGVGLRRGRPPGGVLRPGDALDFWRVERIEPGKLLRLLAEMKTPGRAWLEFEVSPCPAGARIRQTAIFDPIGISGRLYWYALYPMHALVFRGMLRGLARTAQQ